MREIYLDNAAATPADPRVIRAVADASGLPGNPSAFNDAGRKAEKALKAARRDVADFLHAHESEIVFCSSGSQANELALAGARVVTQPTEHLSVLRSVGKRGRFVAVDSQGRVAVENVIGAIRRDTTIVSVMYANNEIGTVQPIAKIGRAISAWRRARGTRYPLFHVDACQAAAYLPMDVQNLGADLVTLNGSKVHGPRGVAVLYVRRGIERSRPAGTENVPAIWGLAKALSLIKKSDAPKVAALRDHFLKKLPKAVPDARMNGPVGNDRLANNISISIPGADSENLLLELDKHGIRVGSGSACTAHSVEPSHVLKAIGTPKKYLDGVLRISLSRLTTKAELNRVLAVLPDVIRQARSRRLK